jgi:glucose/arabinose dehydrogenase
LKTNLLAGLFAGLTVVTMLAGCGVAGSAQNQPPLPTIVQVTPTFTTQPTATPEPPAPTPEPPTATSTRVVPATAVASESSEPAEATPQPEATPTNQPPPPTASPTVVPPTPVPEPLSPPLGSLAVQLSPVAGGFETPVYVTHAGDGSNRLFVVEQPGRIRIVKDNQTVTEPFLDIGALISTQGLEQGLLSVAFHPNFPENGYFYVNYTDLQGDTVIARYTVSDNPDVADPNSAKILLTIGQPYRNHNGGHILFGPDGYLYAGMGDGGSANDPENRAQNLESLLGKILRLDVDNADPYGAPPTNPFIGQGNARPEIWSYGWRNPWRLSFDSLTGDMYVADVGQNQYEEVHVERQGASGGLNYGWRLMEGFHCFNPSDCDPATLNVVLPVTEYDHGQGCSVTGGYVYRGQQFPILEGVYFYGDYCTGTLWGLRAEADGSWSQSELLSTGSTITSFGEDEAGEVYLVDHKGTIFLISATSS